MRAVPQRWRSLPWLADVARAGGQAYAVGGAVRDLLRGAAADDLDVVVTGVPRETLQALLARHGRADDVGAAFAVLKWRGADAGCVDVSLPRVERSTGPGHHDFAVESASDISLAADLARRDFTINAMAVGLPGGELVDPLAGRADLGAAVLRAVGDAGERFREDPVRILRGASFVARFGLTPEPLTRDAMQRCAPGLASVSAERMGAELVKLLRAERPSPGLRLLVDTGALAHLIPELLPSVGFAQNTPHHHLDVWEHVLLAVDEACRRGSGIAVRLAALLHDVAKPDTYSEERLEGGEVRGHFYGHEIQSEARADAILARLRIAAVPDVEANVPRRVRRMILRHLVQLDEHASERAIRRFVHRVGGRDAALELLELWAADRSAHAGGIDEARRAALAARVAASGDVPIDPHSLAVDGAELISRFGLSGPDVGALKQRLLEQVVSGSVPNDRASLLALAERLIG